MTDLCEIAESLGTAESSCPSTSVAVMVYEAGVMASGLVLGFTLGMASAGACSSTVSPYAYTPLVSTASATSTVTSATQLTNSETSSAAARSVTMVVIPLSLSSSGAAASTLLLDFPPPLLSSIGAAASTVAPSLVFGKTLSSVAQALSTLTSHPTEAVSASAAGDSVVAHVLWATTVVTATAAAASTTPFVSLVPNLEVLESIGVTSSTTSIQTEWTAVGEAEANAVSAVFFKDPGRIAWVVNTESTAMSWYDNFDMESIAQFDGATYAVNSEGIFELTGDNDAGEQIDASVRGGFRDFGSANIKRLDTVYLGYISAGTLAALVRVKDSGHPASQFTMETRSATAPRNSRITPAKGLWGRYWQIEMRNISGASFTVYDMDADLAISPRKL